jgi:hypothetical protein
MSDVPAWFAFGVSVAALGVSGLAYYRQRDSVAEARRSADAAETSAQAAMRSAAAEEKAARVAHEVASRRDVRWALRSSDDVHIVVNEGIDSAYEVLVTVPDDVPIGKRVVTPRSGVPFRYSPDYDSAPGSLRVIWQDDREPTSPRYSWEWPLHY